MAKRREGDLRIATWNLERPQALDDPRVAILRQQLQQIDADVLILTETHTDVAPGREYEPSASQPISEGFP